MKKTKSICILSYINTRLLESCRWSVCVYLYLDDTQRDIKWNWHLFMRVFLTLLFFFRCNRVAYIYVTRRCNSLMLKLFLINRKCYFMTISIGVLTDKLRFQLIYDFWDNSSSTKLMQQLYRIDYWTSISPRDLTWKIREREKKVDYHRPRKKKSFFT